ncbi:hypothetical protein HFN01_32420 [Rhizobium leguminosarum]|uniref:hypothetical protein n=1 Tax=Rhizobium leguminosarum TaxID=384 RepID=UPI001C942AA5|nr:hypothetical protein [Rhizobium leguminosarum]MBY5399507.1 hypothetical protein [Rhizobium leguminosarum]
MSKSTPMARGNRWQYPENGDELHRVFTAAKKDTPQQVFDGEGVFTVSYAKRGTEGSAREFLTAGGPDDQ